MAFELRQLTFRIADARGQARLVSFVAGDADDATQSGEWIPGQVRSDLPNMKSIALQQIAALKRVRDLVANAAEVLAPAAVIEETARRWWKILVLSLLGFLIKN